MIILLVPLVLLVSLDPFVLLDPSLPLVPSGKIILRNEINFLNLHPQKGEYQSGQMGQTVNLLAYAFGGSNPSSPTSPQKRICIAYPFLFPSFKYGLDFLKTCCLAFFSQIDFESNGILITFAIALLMNL